MTLDQAKVLVTGATGFTGVRLMHRLSEKGAKLRAIARARSNTDALQDLDIEWIRGDVSDAGVIKVAMKDVQFVFHLAACYREPGASDSAYTDVHVTSTKLLAREATAQPSFQRFVHTSTMGVHGHIDVPPGNELSPYGPGDIYQETKLEAELWIRDYAQAHDLQLTVVRPTAIYGPGDRRLLKLFKFAKQGWFPLLGGHNTLYHLIHVNDLTRFMVDAAVNDQAAGEVYLCGNEAYTDVKSMITSIANHLGKTPKFVYIPKAPTFFVADACEYVCKLFRINPPIYRRRVAFFTKDRAFDTSKMTEDLGFRCEFSNDSGLEDTLIAYQKMGWI